MSVITGRNGITGRSAFVGRKSGRHLAPRKVTAPLTEIAQVVISESVQRRTAVVATASGILISAFAPANGAFNADDTDTHDLAALRAEVDAFLAQAAPEHVAPPVVVSADVNLSVEALLATGVAAVAATGQPEGFVPAAPVDFAANRMGAPSRSLGRTAIDALGLDLGAELGGDLGLDTTDTMISGGDDHFLPSDTLPGSIDDDLSLPNSADGGTGGFEESPTAPVFPTFPAVPLPIIVPPVVAIPAPVPDGSDTPDLPATPDLPVAPVLPEAPAPVDPEPVAPIAPVTPVAPIAPAPPTPVDPSPVDPEPVAPTYPGDASDEHQSQDVTPPAAPTPPPTQNNAPPATVAGNAVLEKAATLVGTPYRAGGSNRNGFDCSGFTQYVFGALGVDLPRTSRAQMNAGTVISRSEAQPGDLIWSPGHIAIYAGNGTQIDAPRPGRSVQFRGIWQRNPVFIRVN